MHVLIVEDDASLGRGLEVAIRRWGHTSEWARDGVRALALAKSVPFELEELAARMRSLHRRVTKSGTAHLEVDRLSIDTRSREAAFDGALLALSRL